MMIRMPRKDQFNLPKTSLHYNSIETILIYFIVFVMQESFSFRRNRNDILYQCVAVFRRFVKAGRV